jgi:hypothetical protein
MSSMKWNKVTEKCLEVYQIDLSHGITPRYRKQIIEVIADEFQKIPRIRIAAVVDRSIQREEKPNNIKNLLTIIQSQLR